MAGVSFELQEILRRKTLFSILKATGYAIALSSGNWLLAVGAILLLGFLFQHVTNFPMSLLTAYRVYVMYVMAISIVISGSFQLLFTRYVADRIFHLELWRILPNHCGALLLTISIGMSVGMVASSILCTGLPFTFHILFTLTVGILSGIWLTSSLLAGLKRYGSVTLAFLISYGYIVFGTLLGFQFGLLGGIFIFYSGQILLLGLLVSQVWREYPSPKLIDWDFLRRDRSYPALAFIGLGINLALWLDKFLFWFHPTTSESVFGGFRASPLYDFPFFLASLSLIPGFATLFLKLEADFAQHYTTYYRAAQSWGSLDDLCYLKEKLLENAHTVLLDSLVTQVVATALLGITATTFPSLFPERSLSRSIFYAFLLGMCLQVILFALFGLLSYFDRRRELLVTAMLFLFANGFFSWTTQRLGPPYYGYGYVISLGIAAGFAFYALRGFLNEIHYHTFMHFGQ